MTQSIKMHIAYDHQAPELQIEANTSIEATNHNEATALQAFANLLYRVKNPVKVAELLNTLAA